MMSSPDPTERAFEPGVVKEKCLTNVQGAKMFPFGGT